jgi:hypothetical protein
MKNDHRNGKGQHAASEERVRFATAGRGIPGRVVGGLFGRSNLVYGFL